MNDEKCESKCPECGCENSFTDSDNTKVHMMVHLLLSQLNQMPIKYGMSAMTQLICSHMNCDKRIFIDLMSQCWDAWSEKYSDE